MKKLFFGFLFCALGLFMLSCQKMDKEADNTTPPVVCEGYSTASDHTEYDSVNMPPFEWYSGDSIVNGYRLYSFKARCEKVCCYADSIEVEISVFLRQNQQWPINVSAKIVLDYNDASYHYAEYSESIPLVNKDECWSIPGNNDYNSFKIYPAPHVAGTHSEYFYVWLNFFVPVHGNSMEDYIYFHNMTRYITILAVYKGFYS